MAVSHRKHAYVICIGFKGNDKGLEACSGDEECGKIVGRGFGLRFDDHDCDIIRLTSMPTQPSKCQHNQLQPYYKNGINT